MMSSDTINLNTHSQLYEKPVEKKGENPPSKKIPSTSSPPSSSNVPLVIEKPNLDLILQPPKATLRKVFFNPKARAAQLYNVVEYLAQDPCAMSTLEVLQSFPTQRKNLLMHLGEFWGH